MLSHASHFFYFPRGGWLVSAWDWQHWWHTESTGGEEGRAPEEPRQHGLRERWEEQPERCVQMYCSTPFLHHTYVVFLLLLEVTSVQKFVPDGPGIFFVEHPDFLGESVRLWCTCLTVQFKASTELAHTHCVAVISTENNFHHTSVSNQCNIFF